MINLNKILSIFAIFALLFAYSCASKGSGSVKGAGTTTEGEATSEEGDAIEASQESMTATIDELKRIYFDFNDATLRGDARSSLQFNAEVLKRFPKVKIAIEGHCDERGSVEYNLALGERRAEAVKRYLAKLGVSVSRVDIISYGEEKPLVYGHSEDAWAKNRRGEFLPQ